MTNSFICLTETNLFFGDSKLNKNLGKAVLSSTCSSNLLENYSVTLQLVKIIFEAFYRYIVSTFNLNKFSGERDFQYLYIYIQILT